MGIPKDWCNKQNIIAEGHSFEDINVPVSRAEWGRPSMVNWSSINKQFLDISERPLKLHTTLYFPLPWCREQSVDVCGLFLTLVCSCLTADVMHTFILVNLFLWSPWWLDASVDLHDSGEADPCRPHLSSGEFSCQARSRMLWITLESLWNSESSIGLAESKWFWWFAHGLLLIWLQPFTSANDS